MRYNLLKISILALVLICLFSGCNKADTSSSVTIKHEQKEAKDELEVLYFKNEVNVGNYCQIIIKGKPNEKYYIKVIYASGESKSKNLNLKTADKNGIVSWKWKIGAKTKPGTYKVKIYQGTELIIKRNLKVI